MVLLDTGWPGVPFPPEGANEWPDVALGPKS